VTTPVEDPDEVVRLTAGNPLFVTELAATGSALPASVGDAVLARLRKLHDPTQRAVGALAVVPGAVEEPLVAALTPDLAHLAAAERAGVLLADGTTMRFRHELVRRAVLAAIPATVQIAAGEQELGALTEAPAGCRTYRLLDSSIRRQSRAVGCRAAISSSSVCAWPGCFHPHGSGQRRRCS
jgi:hypothetical protein